MGQHKSNLMARLAKAGVLPPKESKPSKREVERELESELEMIIFRHFMQRSYLGGIRHELSSPTI